MRTSILFLAFTGFAFGSPTRQRSNRDCTSIRECLELGLDPIPQPTSAEPIKRGAFREILVQFAFIGSPQSIVIPETGNYIFNVAGAAGGRVTGFNGGRAAEVNVSYPMLKGQVITAVVGESGQDSLTSGAGGGGGSFVFTDGDLFIAAGGGGGANFPGGCYGGCDAALTLSGDGQDAGPKLDEGGQGGMDGAGGQGGKGVYDESLGISGNGGGGAGILQEGFDGVGEQAGQGGKTGDLTTGWAGGDGDSDTGGAKGGYGGGGGGSKGPGGGGGWSGGGAGTINDWAGGGGSYAIPGFGTPSTGYWEGSGRVIIWQAYTI